MALLSILCGLLGCRKEPEYTVDDIQSISVSCGHMDYSHSYSFYLRKVKNSWILDAEFAVDTEQPRTEYEECPVLEKDVKKLLSVVQEQQVIDKLHHYKKPSIKVQVADETTYYTYILFASGEQLAAATHISDDLVTCFYHIAEKYSITVA